ncbi:MAG: SulP family inorganic anion transporter [Polyangiales bacterium]
MTAEATAGAPPAAPPADTAGPLPHEAPRGGFGRDLLASFVVFLVALPLSMGIALASGAPILSGLVSAVIGGVVVGMLAGAPLQVSGPAAGLVVLVFGFIREFSFPVVCAITAAAGLIQVLFGVARVASAALAISPAVIHAMLAGIGVQITLGQLHVVLGDAPESSALRNLAALPGQVADLHGGATFLGLLSMAVVLVWNHLPSKRLRAVPAPLVAVGLATLLSVAFSIDAPRVRLPASLTAAFQLPHLPEASKLGAALLAAATLALVASAESLLCAVATDKLHGGPRADLDRELAAQGVGNVLAGLVGGLPVTGVIVRSSANINAGARSRWSSVMHGLWVAVFVSLLGPLLTRIPLSVLAGLLVVIGVNLVNVKHIREVVKHGEGPVYFATLFGVVFINLLAGIGIGVALAAVMLLRKLTRVAVDVESRGERVHVVVRGALSFVGVPKLTEALAKVPAGASVDVDLDVEMIDHAAFEALHSWRLGHEKAGGKVDMDQLHEAWAPRAAPAT